MITGGLIVAHLMSCDLFQIDNYDEPAETVKGEVVDVATGERVLTDQHSTGIRIRLRELSWTETAIPDNFDFWCMKEGVFQNTKVFKGHYNVRLDGPFIPLVRLNQQGDTLVDESKYIDIKGVTSIKVEVQPFLKIEWVGEPTVQEGKITASFRITRAVSPEEFKKKIEPMGGYNDNFLNIYEIYLFVSETPYVGYRDGRTSYSVRQLINNDSFESEFGKTQTITSNGIYPKGRTVFVRIGANINYMTEGVRRYNYNEAKRIDIPN
jgi:hypothetical protein